MNAFSNRRRFLQTAGAGAVATVAGCNQLDTDTAGNRSAESGFEPSDGVVTQVGPTQQELRAIQQEVQAQAQEEGWNQTKIEEEFQRRQQERFEEEVDAFDSLAADLDGVTIENRVAERGIFLLDGSDEALLDALRNEDIDALFPGALFAEAQSSGE